MLGGRSGPDQGGCGGEGGADGEERERSGIDRHGGVVMPVGGLEVVLEYCSPGEMGTEGFKSENGFTVLQNSFEYQAALRLLVGSWNTFRPFQVLYHWSIVDTRHRGPDASDMPRPMVTILLVR